MSPFQTDEAIPRSYDEYYLRIVKAWLAYGCPLGAILLMVFFGWDCLYIRSFGLGIKTLSLRGVVAVAVLYVWAIAPKFQSLQSAMYTCTCLYLLALLDLIAILWLIPGGLLAGVPGMLICMMFSSGMFCWRAEPALLAGSIAVIAYAAASFSSGLNYWQIASETFFLVSGVSTSAAFVVLLDREFRHKHSIQIALADEKEQSETLLKEILPRYVIQRIRDGAQSIAEAVSEVNVIFIDMVGFTEMSRRLAPRHLLEILAETFGSFDRNCERYGVTKIKTIGDAYMAATSTSESGNVSAVAAVEFCLEAIRAVETIAAATGVPVSVRAGIATGAVISGMLSLKRPTYDLWGETVNLAARMESSGKPGRIHISETTYWRVKDRFECEPCGLIDVKGIGPVQTFLLRPLELSVPADGMIAVQPESPG